MTVDLELSAPEIAPAKQHTPRQEARKSARIPELDGLRGMAISLVVAYHYFYYNPPRDYESQGLFARLYVYFERCVSLGWSGVDLFFVLSGFLIGGILLDARGSRSYFRTFYLRRFYRIIPLYYVWIAAFVAASFALRGLLGAQSTDFAWHILPVQFLFLQNIGFVSYAMLARAWLGQTWSLAVEEQFYLISPIIVKVLSRKILYAVLGVVIAGAPIWRFWIRNHMPTFANDLGWAYTLMPSRADALCLGILLALLWKNDVARTWFEAHRMSVAAITGALALGIVPLAATSPGMYPSSHSLAMQSIGYSWLALFYGALTILVLAHPTGIMASLSRVPLLRSIGKIAYCLYLIHEIVGLAAQALLHAVVPHVAAWQTIVAYVFAAVAAYGIASLSWHYFERPLVDRGHAFKY